MKGLFRTLRHFNYSSNILWTTTSNNLNWLVLAIVHDQKVFVEFSFYLAVG